MKNKDRRNTIETIVVTNITDADIVLNDADIVLKKEKGKTGIGISNLRMKLRILALLEIIKKVLRKTKIL